MRKRSTHRHLKENDIHRLRDVTRTCCVEGSFWTVAPNLSVTEKKQSPWYNHAEQNFRISLEAAEVSENDLSPLPDSDFFFNGQWNWKIESAEICCFYNITKVVPRWHALCIRMDVKGFFCTLAMSRAAAKWEADWLLADKSVSHFADIGRSPWARWSEAESS